MTFVTPGGTREVSAEHAILALPFAVLRTLDYERVGFDALKRRAIQELGRGHTAKLHLQFRPRFWVGPGGAGSETSLTDLGYQTTYEVSRSQGGASGLLVNYRGASVAGRLPGEHCSVEFQGYMEGAAAEGIRAAAVVRRDLGR